jgi:hypothetical protein
VTGVTWASGGVRPRGGDDLPGHDHRSGEGRVVADEFHLLDDADPGCDVDEASVDDVGIRRRLTGAA